MDGKVYDTALRHGQSLPLISLRPQDASAPSVIHPTHRPSANHANRSDRNERIGVPNGSGLRAQALAELLNDLAEYRAASPAFRHFWRVLALHDIRRFRRDHLIPERQAFETAVRASSSRRAA